MGFLLYWLRRFFRAAGGAAYDFYDQRYVFLAAALSFYTILAVVPLLIVIASVTSFLPIEQLRWGDIINVIFPNLVMNTEWVVDFLTYESGTYGITGFIAAYLTSQGLFRALDQVLATVFDRPIRSLKEYIRLQLVVYPILLLGMITLYIGATSVSEMMMRLLLLPIFQSGLWYYLGSMLHRATTFFGTISIFTILLLVYQYLAPRKHPKFRYTLFATIYTSVLFYIVKRLFSFYFLHVSNVSSIYGAFSGVFGVLMWVFIAFDLVVYGARFLYWIEADHTLLR